MTGEEGRKGRQGPHGQKGSTGSFGFKGLPGGNGTKVDHRIQYLSLSSVIIDGRNALFFGFSPRLTKIIARIHGVQKIYIINIWGQKQTNVIYLELCVRTRITY